MKSGGKGMPEAIAAFTVLCLASITLPFAGEFSDRILLEPFYFASQRIEMFPKQ